MSQSRVRPRVALILPPFGPANLPSLGLAILSAGVKALGFECRTFFWHYRLAAMLPGDTMAKKVALYESLTSRDVFPWNEWVFTRNLFAGQLAGRDGEALQRLSRLDASRAAQVASGATGYLTPSQLLLHLCNSAGQILTAMVAELEGFDVIGINSTFFQNGAALALAHEVKRRWPQKITVLGGANCDGEMGRGLIESHPFVDYVFSGEVDHSFPEFIRRLDAGEPTDDIPGILYRDADGRIGSGPAAVPVSDLDGLPIPDFDDYVAERKLFGLHREGKLVLPLESSRGCWWGAKSHCTFCGLNANGMAYRQKDPERFQEEVLTIVRRYDTRFLFMADNILSTKYFRTFVQWAREKGLDVDFFYEIKANLNRRQVAELVDAGITMVQPGIESFSSSVLSLMGKGLRGIQNLAFLKYAEDEGLIAAYNLLGGFPGEDRGEYDRLAAEVPKLAHLRPPNGLVDIEYHRFSPYHNHPESFGIRLRPSERYSFVFPYEEERLARLAYLFEVEGAEAADHAYLKPLSEQVDAWRRQYQPETRLLTWRREDGQIVIRDRRPLLGPRDYRLRDHAAAVFEALDQPQTLTTAAREARRLAAETPAPAAAVAPTLPAANDANAQLAYAQAAYGTQAYAAPFYPPAAAAAPHAQALPAGPVQIAQPFAGRPAAAAVPQVLTAAGWTAGAAPWQGLAQPQVAERPIRFSEEEFSADPAACLAELVAAGVIYEEDGWYLSLPTREDAREVRYTWNDTGI